MTGVQTCALPISAAGSGAAVGSGVGWGAAAAAGPAVSSPISRTLPVLSKSLVLCRLGGFGGASPAAAPEPAPTPEPAAAAPLPNYDERSVASLRARLRNLDVAQVRRLAEYERAHAARAEVLTMFERRIAKLEAEA